MRLLFLIMVLISCEQLEDLNEEENCISPLIAEDQSQQELYESPTSQLSCSEFNSRQEYQPRHSCNVLYDSAFENQVIYSNEVVSNILAGGNLTLIGNELYGIESRSVLNMNLNDLNNINYSPLNLSPEKIFSYQDKLIIYGEGKIRITTTENSLIEEFNIGERAEFRQRDQELHILKYRYERELTDEDYCQKIKYFDGRKYGHLLEHSVLDLSELSLDLKGVYFGARTFHIDEQSEYFIYDGNHNGQYVSAIHSGDRHAILNGQVRSSVQLKEYGDLLHVFSDSWSQGSFYQVLNENFESISEINNIAKGETIHAARFNEKYSYLMTFETIDPLFVFDLSDVANPKLVGELKFPGEPRYLQELDENYLVSLGRGLDWNIEISLFDVSMPENPLRVDRLELPLSSWGFEFKASNMLFYGDYFLIKSEAVYFLLKREGERLVVREEIDVLNSSKAFFKQDLFIKDKREWQRIELD